MPPHPLSRGPRDQSISILSNQVWGRTLNRGHSLREAQFYIPLAVEVAGETTVHQIQPDDHMHALAA
jgi:hypothetical protein